MKVETGWGWSPDIGAFWATEDKIYLKNGQVFLNQEDGGYFRGPGFGQPEDLERGMEDYSKWSDEKRFDVLTESKRTWAESEAFYAALKVEREALRASARLKLTPEEYQACQTED